MYNSIYWVWFSKEWGTEINTFKGICLRESVLDCVCQSLSHICKGFLILEINGIKLMNSETRAIIIDDILALLYPKYHWEVWSQELESGDLSTLEKDGEIVRKGVRVFNIDWELQMRKCGEESSQLIYLVNKSRDNLKVAIVSAFHFTTGSFQLSPLVSMRMASSS